MEAVVKEKVILSGQGRYDYLHQLRISLQIDMMAMLKVIEDTKEACYMETLLFPLLSKVESEKEKPSLFSLSSVNLLHAPSSLSPVLW